jgi:hypothetical protein
MRYTKTSTEKPVAGTPVWRHEDNIKMDIKEIP